MAGNALYDVGMRMRAVELHNEGRGRASIASLPGIPEGTVSMCNLHPSPITHPQLHILHCV